MGIKGLTQLIKINAPTAIQTTNLHKLAGKKVAIDSSLFIYKMLINVRTNNQSYLTGKDGKVVSHVTGIFYKTANYLSLGITPIYVFDGKPPINKQQVIKNRHKKVANAKLAIENTESQIMKNHLEKQTIRLTKQHIEDVKQLLDLMGVSYVQANGEAEAYASEMCRQGMVDYVVTEDMDTMAFGCPRMIRTCLDRSIKRKDIISIIDLDETLRCFKLTYPQFVDLCILCGCDYCDNIPRIGNKTAFQLVNKHTRIEDILPAVKNVPEDYETNYTSSRRLFTMYHDKLDMQQLTIHHSSWNLDKLYDFLVKECFMNNKRVLNTFRKMKQGYK